MSKTWVEEWGKSTYSVCDNEWCGNHGLVANHPRSGKDTALICGICGEAVRVFQKKKKLPGKWVYAKS